MDDRPENGQSGPPGDSEATESALSRLEGRVGEIADRLEKPDVIELVAVTILALATVVTAFSAWQSSRWSSERSTASVESVAVRTEAAQAVSLVTAQANANSQLIIAWLLEADDEDAGGMDVLEDRMGPALRQAFEEWIGQVPEGEIPPDTPMLMPDFGLSRSDAQRLAEQLNSKADELAARADEASRASDDYVLTTVIMASVLFFAGVGVKFRRPGSRAFLASLAVVLFLVGCAYVLSLPRTLV